jgi:nitrogenase molybdenum-iron protein beta chain
MTEDAAVFSGLKNMIEGLANTYALYKPKMIAVCTTCMAEVIGDDLGAFITNSKNEGSVPKDFPVPYAHTPSFVGSHITGYDNMMKGILSNLTEGKKAATTNGKINFIPGFETYMGNLRELKHLTAALGVNTTILGDNEDYLDSPNDGEYKMYQGGTTLEEGADSINATQTIALQAYSTTKTRDYIAKEWGQKTAVYRPWGIKGTDDFLIALSEATGNPIPAEIEKERGRAVDAMTDTQAWLHGKRTALYGDPDLVIGLLQFLLEMGIEPIHVLVTNSNPEFEAEAKALLESSPYGKGATVWGGKDLWHLRSLLFTEPVDFFIGNSYGKYLWRDTHTPIVRIGYPIFDRHHLHRYSTIGYNGAINLLNWIANTVLDELDRNTIIPAKTDISYDLIR